MKNIACTFLVAAILAGCSSTAPKKIDVSSLVKQENINTDEIEVTLFSAVDKTSVALTKLSEVRKAESKDDTKVPFKSNLDPALNTHLFIDWYGPIGPVVKKIAGIVGYKYQMYGVRPELPVIVNVTSGSRSAINVLRDIELQSNNQARISVLSKEKLITLRYISND